MPADKRLKIACISSYDPLDKGVWSGTPYSIYRALLKHVGEVDVLGPCTPQWQLNMGKIRNRLARLFTGKRYNYVHSFSLANAYSRYFSKKLAQKKYDLIVAPSASSVIARLVTDVPIVYITDSTVQVSLNYHDNLSNLLPSSVKESLVVEQAALNNSSLCLFSSQWAARSAEEYFKIPSSKMKVLPFGANFELLPAAKDIKYDKLPEVWELLFVGVYWESKGGEMAFNCLVKLLDMGVKARLTVCGCIPPEKFRHQAMEVIPFLDKNKPEDAKKLSVLFERANFLLLPTRFDCTPIVICEASAYGIPTLCADTGGVKGHLKEGVNGFLIDYEDKGDLYAKKIMEIIMDPTAYFTLRRSSRKIYDESLNWDIWAMQLKPVLEALVKN